MIHRRAAARAMPTKSLEPKLGDFDGSFIYCRGFSSSRREAGGMGWWTDYPAADNNFSVRLMEFGPAHVMLDEERQPNTVVVRLSDPSSLPLRHALHGRHRHHAAERRRGSRRISDRALLKARFSLGRRLGDRRRGRSVVESDRAARAAAGEFSIFDIPADHPIMHVNAA